MLQFETVRNYFGGVNYQFGKNQGLHIERSVDGGIVVLDDTTIYDMAVKISRSRTISNLLRFFKCICELAGHLRIPEDMTFRIISKYCCMAEHNRNT